MKRWFVFLLSILFVGSGLYSQDLSPVFSASFESNSTSPEADAMVTDIENGSITVVSNPEKDDVNSSNYVIRVQTGPSSSSGHSRAEYRNVTRMPTEGKEHIFQWMVYFPDDYMDDIEVRNGWSIITQFWSEPCSKYTNSSDSYYDRFYDNICYSGGIFNEIQMNPDNSSQYMMKFRASPDCFKAYFDYPRGEWVKITYQIYWTTGSDGYFNVYLNNELFYSQEGVKTLPDGWVDGTCDLRWKVGLYDAWSSDTKSSVYYYIDDINWYIGESLADVCAGCVGGSAAVAAEEDPCLDYALSGQTVDSDYGEDNGSITLNVTGGTEPYTYLWNDGSLLSNRSDLSPGEYTVTVTDSESCTESSVFDIGENEAVAVDSNVSFQLKSMSPNPTQCMVAIEYTSPSAGDVDIEVENAAGDVVKTKTVSAIIGDNKATICLNVDDSNNELSSGEYTIYVIKGSNSFNSKVVKE